MSDWSKCLHNPDLVGVKRQAVLSNLNETRRLLDANPGVVFETKPAVITYPRTRRSWLSDAQAFIDILIVLLLASVFLNVYLAIKVLEVSK